MTDAGYVITAWTLTGVALGGYAAMILVRIRRAERYESTEQQ
jgi:hypothetical protein